MTLNRAMPSGIASAKSYHEYLKSDKWLERRQAHVSKNPSCYVCGCSNPRILEVHHNTYAFIGAERDHDLVTLCAAHHGYVHELIRKFPEHYNLQNAHSRVRFEHNCKGRMVGNTQDRLAAALDKAFHTKMQAQTPSCKKKESKKRRHSKALRSAGYKSTSTQRESRTAFTPEHLK